MKQPALGAGSSPVTFQSVVPAAPSMAITPPSLIVREAKTTGLPLAKTSATTGLAVPFQKANPLFHLSVGANTGPVTTGGAVKVKLPSALKMLSVPLSGVVILTAGRLAPPEARSFSSTPGAGTVSVSPRRTL